MKVKELKLWTIQIEGADEPIATVAPDGQIPNIEGLGKVLALQRVSMDSFCYVVNMPDGDTAAPLYKVELAAAEGEKRKGFHLATLDNPWSCAQEMLGRHNEGAQIAALDVAEINLRLPG